jgi:hypothetical protein
MSSEIVSPCGSLAIAGLLSTGFAFQSLGINEPIGGSVLAIPQLLYGVGACSASFVGGRYLMASLVGRVSSEETFDQLKASMLYRITAVTLSALTLVSAIVYLGTSGAEYVLPLVPPENALSTIHSLAVWGVSCVALAVAGSAYQSNSELYQQIEQRVIEV